MFDDDTYYKPSDPKLAIFGKPETMREWRHRKKGPRYVKFGNRILYRGRELNKWLAEHEVDPKGA